MSHFEQAAMQAMKDKAFSEAAKIPAHCLQALRIRIDQLVVEGASFHEAKKVLQPLYADLLKTQEESA